MIRARRVVVGALSAVLMLVPVACADDTAGDDPDASTSTSTTSTTTIEPDSTSSSGPSSTAASGPATTVSVAEVFTDPNDVRDMAADDEGRIWAVGPGGVTRFDPDTGERRTLTVADGLPTHEIYAVAVDGEVVWLGTQFGLVSIEGDTVVEHGPALPAGDPAATDLDVSPRMYGVTLGPDGAVWAYRAPEVVRYADGSWETVARLGGTSPFPYPKIAVADDGTAWVSGVDLGPAGASTLVRLVGDSAEPVPGFSGFSGADAALELALAPNGDLWVATSEQVARHRDGEWTRWTVGDDVPGATAHGLALGDDGLPWVITRELDDSETDDVREQPVIEHEVRFDGSAWQIEATTDLAGPGGPRPVVVLDDKPWTPNGDGLRARIDGEATVVSLGNGFVGTNVSSVAVADDGIVWALTDRNLLRYDGERWTLTPGWPGSTDTAEVVAVSGSEAWALLGTSSRRQSDSLLPDLGPLAHVDEDTLEVIDPWDGPQAPLIRDIDLDADDTVVLATTAGPARLDGGAAVVEPIPSLDPAGIGQIHVAPDATIWASSQGRVLARDDDAWTLRASGETWLDSALAVEPDGIVWTGGFRLLGRLDDTGWQTWTELDTEPIAVVAALALDPDGAIFVGIQGDEFAEETVALRDRRRLWVLEDDTWVARDPADVPLSPITSLAFAADGSLWVGTTHGLVHLPSDWAS